MKPPSFEHLIASTQSIEQISSQQLGVALGLALILGALMAYVYRFTAREDFNPAIAQSLVFLTALMTLVMLIVGDTLSRAFGSVGILSMMRFRIKFKSPIDPLILLSGVVVGMACGTGMVKVAVGGTLFLCFLIVIQGHLFKPRKPENSFKDEL
jgi:hypothetical protein